LSAALRAFFAVLQQPLWRITENAFWRSCRRLGAQVGLVSHAYNVDEIETVGKAQPPSESETERLSLIRYQLLVARQILQSPSPINSLAMNAMQDTVESVLGAAGDHVRAQIPNRADFDKLFDAVAAALGSPDEIVGLRRAAIALNNARVGLKHHGNLVRDETLRRHFDVATTLSNELVKSAFGLELDAISMLVFVKDDQARGLIESAEEHFGRGDLPQAMFRLRLAFDLMVEEYESRKSTNGWGSIFDTKPSFYPSSLDLKREFGREGGDYIGKIGEWVASLDSLTRLGAHGVDLQRYAYFDATAPVVQYYLGDLAPVMFERFKGPLTEEHFRSGYLFVVDSGIRLAANDYDLQPTMRAQHSDFRSKYDPDHKPSERDQSTEASDAEGSGNESQSS